MNISIQSISASAKHLMDTLRNRKVLNTKHTTTQLRGNTTMNTNYTTDDIRDMDSIEFDLISFVLSGKVAGRITSLAMSLAGTQIRRSSHLDESDQPAIDEFNSRMAELDQIESQNEFFSNAGIEQPLDKEHELRAWLGVRHVMVERGYVPSALAENFKWMIEQTIKRNNPSDKELQELADASDFDLEQMRTIYKAKSKRAIDDTMEVSTHAMRLVNDYEPDEMTTPDGFDDIVHASIERSQKSAIVRGNNTEDALANLIVLKAMQPDS